MANAGVVGRATGRDRVAWVDALRVISVVGVVVVHTATGYVTDIADWYYDDELRPTTIGFAVFAVPALLGGVFGLGPLFWLAGWFSVPAVRRRGPSGFALDRALRLGVPMVAYVLVLNPLADLVGDLRGHPRSFVDYLGETEFSVTWFLAALLVCSVGYATLRAVRPERPRARPPGVPVLLAGAALVTAAALLTWPVTSLLDEDLMSLRLGAWFHGVVLFALGALAAESLPEPRDPDGTVTGVPGGRVWGWVALAGSAGVVALVASGGREDLAGLLHEWRWQTLSFAVAYGLVSVSFTLWCLRWFARRGPGGGRWTRRAGRAAYATYLLHPLVLTGLMVALAPVPLAAEPKFLLVVVLAVPACFAVGDLATGLSGARRLRSPPAGRTGDRRTRT